MAAYVGQKYLLQWIAEPLDRPGKRQPFNRDDILHHLVARLRLGPHEPEPHHLWPATRLVSDDTEEFADFHTEPGFFDHLAPRAPLDGMLVPPQLAAGQHPELVL